MPLLLFFFIGLISVTWANVNHKVTFISAQQIYDQHVATIVNSAVDISGQLQQQQWATPYILISLHNTHASGNTICSDITVDNSTPDTRPTRTISTFQQAETNGSEPPAVFLASLRAAKSGANNSNDGIKLNKQLGSQQQIGETGTTIAGTGSKHTFRDADKIAEQYGGNPSD